MDAVYLPFLVHDLRDFLAPSRIWSPRIRAILEGRTQQISILRSPRWCGMGRPESADSKFGNGGKKIAKIMHKEGEIEPASI